MPDILGATNPVPGYDKSNTTRGVPVAPDKVQIQNSPDLTRVSRADGRTERQDSGADGRVRYDSNFQTFAQRLGNTPSLTETMSRIFSLREGIVVSSGLEGGASEDMARLMSMLQMDEQQLLAFFGGQLRSGSQLGGALFALLRGAYAGASSAAVQEDILQFVRHYLDYAASGHVEGNLLRDLRMLTQAMPASWAERLRDLLAQLDNGVQAGDRQGNLQLLQREVLPYVSKYIEQTHDMGLARQLTTMLALHVAQYDSGSQESMLAAFHRLASYGTLKSTLGQLDDEGLLTVLERTRAGAAAPDVRFADQLASMAAKGLRGAGGAELQQAYQDLIQAILINESVYMPLNHYLLPLQWEDRLLFSELWVDPDAENDRDGASGGRGIRVLIKMDVQALGLFDIILHSRDGVVDVNVSCPEAAEGFFRQLEQGVTEILARNELRPGQVTVRKMGTPVTLTEVFPRIFEGMNSVNVKV